MTEVANQKLNTEIRDVRDESEELLRKLNELSAQLQKKDEELIATLTRYLLFIYMFRQFLFKSYYQRFHVLEWFPYHFLPHCCNT